MEKCTQELACDALHRKLKGTQIWLNLTAGKTGGREKRTLATWQNAQSEGKRQLVGNSPWQGL